MALVYAQLFDPSYAKDEGLYKVLFATPVVEDALRQTMVANLDQMMTDGASDNREVFTDMLRYGITFFNDAIRYNTRSDGPDPKNSEKDTETSEPEADLEDDGDDITSMGTGATQAPEEDAKYTPRAPFEDIDDELRAELILNILHSLQTWFLAVYEVTKRHHRLAALLLFSQGLLVSHETVRDILVRLRWYLEGSIAEIAAAGPETEFVTLPALKELLALVAAMLKCFYLGFTFSQGLDGELLATVGDSGVGTSLSRLLEVTAAKEVDGKVQAAALHLLAETLITLYGVLASILAISRFHQHSQSVETDREDDLTNVARASDADFTLLPFSRAKYLQEVAFRLVPLLAMEFDYCRSYRDDLLLRQMGLGLFFSWLTGNRFGRDALYREIVTEELVTNLELPECRLLSATDDPDDVFLAEIRQVLATKRSRRHHEDLLEMPELLPLSLVLHSLVANPTFVAELVVSSNPDVAIEDIDPQENRQADLLDLWLCVMSYVCQYQYRSRHFELIARLSLATLTRLNLPANVAAMGRYRVNEFMWKVARQKLPFVPLDHGGYGFKSALFYSLDVVQNLLRFNLTNKLKIDNYQMAVNVIYQVVKALAGDKEAVVERYHWDSLYKLLLSTLVFITKQKLASLKYFEALGQTGTVLAVAEEILAVFDQVLEPRFSRVVEPERQLSINYDLVYAVLMDRKYVVEAMGATKALFPRLEHCLGYFDDRIHLTESSKAEGGDKIDLYDYNFDSPVLIDLLNQYLVKESLPDTPALGFRAELFKYVNDNDEMSSTDALQVINLTLAPDCKPMSRFFQERAGEEKEKQ